jgi:hypothetical protein
MFSSSTQIRDVMVHIGALRGLLMQLKLPVQLFASILHSRELQKSINFISQCPKESRAGRSRFELIAKPSHCKKLSNWSDRKCARKNNCHLKLQPKSPFERDSFSLSPFLCSSLLIANQLLFSDFVTFPVSGSFGQVHLPIYRL